MYKQLFCPTAVMLMEVNMVQRAKLRHRRTNDRTVPPRERKLLSLKKYSDLQHFKGIVCSREIMLPSSHAGEFIACEH